MKRVKDNDLVSGSYSSVLSGWVAMPELYSNLKLNSVPFFVRIYAVWKRIFALQTNFTSNINHIKINKTILIKVLVESNLMWSMHKIPPNSETMHGICFKTYNKLLISTIMQTFTNLCENFHIHFDKFCVTSSP